MYKYPLTDFGESVSPIVPVRLINPLNGLETTIVHNALIDTGADSCCIPKLIAEEIGCDFRGGKTGTVRGLGGSSIKCYQLPIVIQLLSMKLKPVWESEECLIDCIDTEIPILLGYLEFLSNVKLTIDYPTGLLNIKI